MTTIRMPERERYVQYPVGDDIQAAVTFAEDTAKVFNERYDSDYVNIWCRGSSGAILAALFASKLNAAYVKVIHVKKDGEYSHGSTTSLGEGCNPINVVIDDFIATGETLEKIHKYMATEDVYKIDVLVIGNGHYVTRLTFKPETIITYPPRE